MVRLFVVEPPSNSNPSGELPVTIEHTQDTNTSSNLTRNDANCDKTGTCYDGNYALFYLAGNRSLINCHFRELVSRVD